MKKKTLASCFRMSIVIAFFIYIGYSDPLIVRHINNTVSHPLSAFLSISMIVLQAIAIVLIVPLNGKEEKTNEWSWKPYG